MSIPAKNLFYNDIKRSVAGDLVDVQNTFYVVLLMFTKAL